MKKYIIVYLIHFLLQCAAERLTTYSIFSIEFFIVIMIMMKLVVSSDGHHQSAMMELQKLGMYGRWPSVCLEGWICRKHPLLSKRASTDVYSGNLWIDRQQLWRNTNVANCVFTPRRLLSSPTTIDSRQRGLNDFPRSAIVLHLTH